MYSDIGISHLNTNKSFTAADAEDAEFTQRVESILCASSALSASAAVNVRLSRTLLQIAMV